MKLEYRDAVGTGHLKDVDSGKREVQVIFPHESPDTFKTVFLPDTFTRDFEEHLPVMCWMHNLREPIGIATSAQSTAAGNEVVGAFSKFDPVDGVCPVPLAMRAFSQLEDGTLKDFSFGFLRNGPVKPWGGQRGITAFTRARMYEFSPVSIGSIPGAHMTGLREDGTPIEEVEVPDIETLLKLREGKHISELEFRKMLALTLPENYREHIELSSPPADDVLAPTGDGGDPAIRAASGNIVGPDDGHKVQDGALLAQAVDAALDRAIQLFQAVDLTDVDANIRQGVDLVYAAGVSVDEMLERMGIDDPDDDDDDDEDDDGYQKKTQGSAGGDTEGGGSPREEDFSNLEVRASMSTADRTALSNDDFGYIEPGAKTGEGVSKTPENGYHFPIHDAAHVRNALARIGGGAEFGDKAKSKVMAAAKKFGIDTSERALQAYSDRLVELETRDAELETRNAELAAEAARVQAKLDRRVGAKR
jgi:phage head maturation protease